MNSPRISGRRMLAIPLSAALLSFAVTAPAAFAAGDDHEQQRIPMPQPRYEQTAGIATRAERCRTFERRFDAAAKAHQNAAQIDEAKTLRIEGGELCSNGDPSLGIHKLREALDRIGVDSRL